jgi:hypothetical protein
VTRIHNPGAIANKFQDDSTRIGTFDPEIVRISISIYWDTKVASIGESNVTSCAGGNSDFESGGYGCCKRGAGVSSDSCASYSQVRGDGGGSALKAVVLEELAVDSAVARVVDILGSKLVVGMGGRKEKEEIPQT